MVDPSRINEEARHALEVERAVKRHRKANKSIVVFVLLALIYWPIAVGFLTHWAWGVVWSLVTLVALPVIFSASLFSDLRLMLWLHLFLIFLVLVGGLWQILKARWQVE